MAGKPRPIRWTIEQASIEFDVDRKTLTKRLRDTEGGKDFRYSTLDICRALFDDSEAEKTRQYRENADRLALANARTRGETVDVQTVYRSYESVFVAIRQTILASNLTDHEKSEMLGQLRHDTTHAPNGE